MSDYKQPWQLPTPAPMPAAEHFEQPASMPDVPMQTGFFEDAVTTGAKG